MTNKVFTDYETVIDAAWLNDVNTTVNTTVPGLASTKAELAGSSTQSFAASDLTVGDQGTEGSGINVGGVTYESSFKVSDIDGTNYAQSVFHRHSTTLEPLLLGARSNSDTSGHTNVTSGQGLFTIFATGVAGTNYKLFGASSFAVDTGTVSDTSAPGKWTLSLTPDGSTTLIPRITVSNSGKTTISSTESLVVPTGTTAQRDATPTTGGLRANTTLNQVETYLNSAWQGLVGLIANKISFINIAGTFTSFFTNANTAARTYTFQDRDGIIADTTDIAGLNNILGTVSGVDTITAAASPTLIAQPATGSVWTLPSAGANTGSATLNIDSQGALAIVRPDGTALQSGDIPFASYLCRVEKRASDYLLLNPAGYVQLSGSKGIGIMKFGAINVPQNATNYIASPGGIVRSAAVNAARVASQDITISELRVNLSAVVAASQSIVLTLGVNGSDTALTCTIGAGASTGSDTTHSVQIAAGSYYYIKVVTSATFGSVTDLGATVVVRDITDSHGLTPMHFGAYNAGTGTVVFGDNDSTGALTYTLFYLPIPPCIVSNYVCGILGAAGLSASGQGENTRKSGVDFITVKSGVPTNATPKAIFSEGDTFVSMLDNCVATTVYAESLVVSPINPMSYPPCFTQYGSSSQAQATTYYMGSYGTNNQSLVESDVSIPMPACTVKNLRIWDSAAVGATTTVITLRKNGVDTALTATLTTSGQLASDLTNTVTFAAGDLLSLKCVTGATTGTRSYTATFETIA